jgi:two-component system LytT family response regulator
MDSTAVYSKVKIVIIDDEQRNIDLLKQLIAKHNPEAIVIGEATCVDSGFDLIKTASPDLVLLDISMPPYNSFDMLKLFEEINFSIVFITAYSEYAIQAIKFSALDYLLKPVKADELKTAIRKFSNLSSRNNTDQVRLLQEPNQHTVKPQKIVINSLQQHSVIEIKNINYLKSSGNYTEFYFIDGTNLVSSRPVKQYETLLQGQNFYRIHKSFLVNLDQVTKVLTTDGGEIELKNGVLLPLAHRRMDLFLKYMNARL